MRTALFHSLTLVVALCLSAGEAHAQKPLLNSQAEVEAFVHAAIGNDLTSGKLHKQAAEMSAHGAFSVVITVDHKGEVETVLVLESTIQEIPVRNFLKDYVKNMRFDLKLPKGKRFTLTETLTFN
jgi:outer membrane biosynthesis protein TonB